MPTHWLSDSQALNQAANAGKQDYGSSGESINGSRIQQLQVKFDEPVASADVTTTTLNGGSVSQVAGLGYLSSSTSANGLIRVQSNGTLRYSPGRELYFAGTLALDALPTSANTAIRFGAFDDNDGIWIGFVGSEPVVATRTGGVDTVIPRSQWNMDLLDGNEDSRFTRENDDEPIDFTKINIFRVRWLHYGTGCISYEVMNPDGRWTQFHCIRRPNTSGVLSVANTNLPLRSEVVKVGADAQDVVVKHGCWDAGTVEDPVSFSLDELRGRKYVSSVATASASGVVHTNTAGRSLRIATANISVNNTSGQAGILNLRDGIAGTLLESVYVNSQNITNLSISYPVSKRASVGVYVEITGSLTYAVSVTGYETD